PTTRRVQPTCRACLNSLCWPLRTPGQQPPARQRTMGHRLSKIVTRTGDAGTTGLGDGTRVAKDSARVEAIGAVDELNSALGVLAAEMLPVPIAACILDVQHDLFDLGGELSIPGHAVITEAHVERMETAVERFN